VSTEGASTGTTSGNATGAGAGSGVAPCPSYCPDGTMGTFGAIPSDGGSDTCTVQIFRFGNCSSLTCIVPCGPDAATDASPAVEAGMDVDAQQQDDVHEELRVVAADANGVE
jgi:hypothetical protein